MSSTTFASLNPDREALYSCVNYNDSEVVEGAVIYRSQFGKAKAFYEIQLNIFIDGLESTYIKKVNLVSKYEGRVQVYTTGGFRIKVDRVRRDANNHFAAFARFPDYDVHSSDWSCKDY